MVASHRKIVQADIQKMHVHLQSWLVQGPLNEVFISVTGSNQKPLFGQDGIDDISPNIYEWEIDQAAMEIAEEQHQSLGLMDGMKALFMWVEAPEERVFKSHDGVLTHTHEVAS
jgi:hypothetical protein